MAKSKKAAAHHEGACPAKVTKKRKGGKKGGRKGKKGGKKGGRKSKK